MILNQFQLLRLTLNLSMNFGLSVVLFHIFLAIAILLQFSIFVFPRSYLIHPPILTYICQYLSYFLHKPICKNLLPHPFDLLRPSFITPSSFSSLTIFSTRFFSMDGLLAIIYTNHRNFWRGYFRL